MEKAIASEAVDISGFLPTHTIRLPIISPNGRDMNWVWTLAATSHEKNAAFMENRAADELEQARIYKEAQYNGRFIEGEKTTPEQDRRRSVQWISARVLGFTPVKINGQLYEHSDKTVEDLLIRPEMHFVLLQITKALNDDARFTARSAEV